MGKGICCLACFSHDSKKKKNQSKYPWEFEVVKYPDLSPPTAEIVPAPPPPCFENVKLADAENEQTKPVNFVEKPVVVNESAIDPELGAAEVVRPKGEATVVVDESALVPEPESALVQESGSAFVPEPESAIVPEPESAIVPEPESAIVPEPESAIAPEADGAEAVLTKKKATAAVEESDIFPEPDDVEVVQPNRNASAVVDESASVHEPSTDEVPQPKSVIKNTGNAEEDVAAVKIQTAFRGYLAKRELRALRGLDRLKTLIDGESVKRQTTTTLRCLQTLARVQSQIIARRIRMSEENDAIQRQLQRKREKELEKLRMGEEWDASQQSKEQMEAKLMHKYEAALRRERALAYAYTHQQILKHTNTANLTYLDPNNPHWGWSWLERWMAARPWESRSTYDKELNDNSSVRSGSQSVAGEISRGYALRELNGERPSPSPTSKKLRRRPSHQSPFSPPSKATSAASSVTGRSKPPSPRGGFWVPDDDARSMRSVQSGRYRRHSVPGSPSVRDDVSLASSSASVPNYMAPTKSATAKSRMQSPLGSEKSVTAEKGLVGSAKKKLSFTASPARPRRHSFPPTVGNNNPITDTGETSEHNVSKGENK